MRQPSSRQALLVWLRRVLASLDRGEKPTPEWKRDWFNVFPASDLDAPRRPAGSVAVVGEATGVDPVRFLADGLSNLDWGRDAASNGAAKLKCSLRTLAWSLAPDDDSLAPLVSIVIPVFNGADCIDRAVASGLAQTHPNVEVVVVDDGSTDGTSDRAASTPGPVRVVRQANAGPAAARNRGVREAKGDFVHFLDADDELSPHAVADKLSALAQTPDANLCFSHFSVAGGPGEEDRYEQIPLDDPRSAVWDPMLAAASRFPFQLSAVLAPRWYLQWVGPMEEDMRQSEDVRWYFAMARKGVKAIAVASPTVRRHRRPGSLTQNVLQARAWAIEADLRSASELAREPRMYRYLVCLMTRATWLLDRAYDEGMEQSQVERFHERMLALEAALGGAATFADGASAILFDQLALMLRRKCAHAADPAKPTVRLWHERELQLQDRLESAPRVGGADVRRWLPDVPPRPYDRLSPRERASLKFGLDQLQSSLVLGRLFISLGALDRLGSRFPGHPYERFWRSARRLARVVGEDAARAMVRRTVFRGGWKLLGRVRRMMELQRAV